LSYSLFLENDCVAHTFHAIFYQILEIVSVLAGVEILRCNFRDNVFNIKNLAEFFRFFLAQKLLFLGVQTLVT